MIEASFVLVAGELAVFTERDDVEPVAISVEMIFGKIFVPFDFISGAELFSFGPGFRFDANEFDIAVIGVFLEEIMTKLMEEFE